MEKLVKPSKKVITRVKNQLAKEGYYCHVSEDDPVQFICINTRDLTENPIFRAIAIVTRDTKTNNKRAFNGLSLLHVGLIQREIWTIVDEEVRILIL